MNLSYITVVVNLLGFGVGWRKHDLAVTFLFGLNAVQNLWNAVSETRSARRMTKWRKKTFGEDW